MDTSNINPQQSEGPQKPDISKELAHVTKEMYKKNLELAQKNKTLSLPDFTKIDEILVLTSASFSN